MANISRKNINLLVDKFLKNPNEFSNYIKGQLDTLDKFNMLKELQYNELCDDFTFFKFLYGNIPISFELVEIYNLFKKEIISKLSKDKMLKIETNVIYVDAIKEYFDRLNKVKNNDEYTHFFRMACLLYGNQNIDDSSIDSTKLSNKKVYTFDELFDLCKKRKLVIVDNILEDIDISYDDVINKTDTGEVVLSNANLNCLNYDNNILEDFVQCNNEFDRKVWQLVYGYFINYLRYNLITFDKKKSTNLVEVDGEDFLCNHVIDFNEKYMEVYNHILLIINTIKAKYKKNKKNIPKRHADIIADTLCRLEELKNDCCAIDKEYSYCKKNKDEIN